MPSGIFNPYKEPEKPKPKKVSDAGIETKLDGGSYAIVLKNTSLKNVPARLGRLVATIGKDNGDHLLKHGISLIPRGATYQLEDGEVQLPTPDGHLCVYIGDEFMGDTGMEDEVFRRLAHAVYTLNNPSLLKELDISVIKRG